MIIAPGHAALESDSWQSLERLVQDHRQGFSLAQDFYHAAPVYQAELHRFLSCHWIAAGHASEIPERGDYLLFGGLDSSVIVVRAADGEIHALHNVCRHRGARLCEEPGAASR